MAKPELKVEAIRLRQEERLSLSAIAQKLSVSQSSCSYWLRAYPLSKEEISERNRLPKQYVNHLSAPPLFVNPCTQNTDGKGTIALMQFLLRAAEKNVATSIPTQPLRYDVIIDQGGILGRVQVKYSGSQLSNGSFMVKVTSLGHSKKKKRYTVDQVDFIAAYSPITDKVYLLPPAVWEGKTEVYLRYEPARNNQKSGLVDASQYEW